MTGRPGRRPAPSYSRSQTGPRRSRRAGRAPWPCPSPSRHRSATTTVPSRPNDAERGRRRARTVSAPGSARPRRRPPSATPRRRRGCRGRGRRRPTAATPGSVTTNARDPPSRGDHLGQPLDLADAEQHAVAQGHLEPPVGQRPHQRTSSTTSMLVSRRTVSQRRQPTAWNQRSVVGPSGFSKIQTSSKSRSSGSSMRRGRRAPLAAEDELVERAAAAARAVEPGHQRVPAEPASASDVVAPEPVERERRDERRRTARRDELGHALAAGRDRLEAPGPPARRDVEAVDRRSRS